MTDSTSTAAPPTVHTSQPDPLPTKPRAHVFFWSVLGAAAVVSITGNATQALLHETALPLVAASVAVIPPLALLAAVHGVSVLARAHVSTRATHWIAATMTALIAAGAFWLSFTALRALAITAGVPRGEAWLWPLIIEGSMAQSTVALLALAHAAGNDVRTHPSTSRAPVATLPDSSDHDPVTGMVDRSVCTRSGEPQRGPTASLYGERRILHRASEQEDFEQIAALLCARDPGRRRDPEIVARALVHHHRDGWNATRISQELNRSRSTISRILSDAAELDTDDPETVAGSGGESSELSSEVVIGTEDLSTIRPQRDSMIAKG
ncbi:DUF2637 domain-containing protein [Nocardia takedensis]|uniref:DUF2637 domain-containing protein n=1 Tax=Nocardia takedensis TaxID=259390 RepID=UPI0006883804|nr:DUF2637 domain-containing protein [Nocardia takedensis]